MKQLLLGALLLTVMGGLALAADSTININVTSCSGGTSCTLANYNTNDTNTAHTISKSQTGVADTWSNVPFSADANVKDVTFVLRHSGEASITGSWTIIFTNEADTSNYCTDNTIAHATTDTQVTRNTTGSCSWTVTKLNNLRTEFTSGDGGGPSAAYIYYADLFIKYNDVPTFTAALSGNTTVTDGDDIQYYATGTDPEGDDYRMTVCASSGITDGYPGTCTGTTLCTSAATSSGSQTNCNYTTTTDGTINAYAYLCDEGSGDCNSTASTKSTTVNPLLGYLSVSINLPSTDPLYVDVNDTFLVNATVTCEGEVGATCGSVEAAVRYNASGSSPDTNVSTTIEDAPLYMGYLSTHNPVIDEGAGTTDSQNYFLGDSSISSTPIRSYTRFIPTNDMTINEMTFDIANTFGSDYSPSITVSICTGVSACTGTGCTTFNSTWSPTWSTGEQTITGTSYSVTGGNTYYVAVVTSAGDGDSNGDYLTIKIDQSATGDYDVYYSLCSGSSDYGDVTLGGEVTFNNPNTCSASLTQGTNCTVQWPITFNDENASYELDVLFSSGYESISDNNTADKTVLNVTGGGGPPPSDSCTYGGSGAWNVDCTDNCEISTNYDLAGEDITFDGAGLIRVTSDINNYGVTRIQNACVVRLVNGGSIA